MQLPRQPTAFFASATFRWTVLSAWLACTVVTAYLAATGFRIDNSVGVWFAEDDPALDDYRRFLNDFGEREWMLVAVEWTAATEDVSRKDRSEIVSRLERIENVHWVMSALDFREASDIVRKFLQPDPSSSREAFLLHVTNDIDRQDGYREALLAEIRGLAAELPAVTSVQIAGTAVINGELNRAARRDMFLFFPAVALFVALLGWVVFRNARDTAVLMAVSMSTVVITEGLLVAVGYPLNMITIMLPTVLIALSVADAIHLIHAFHGSRIHTGEIEAAATRAVKSVVWPCAGTSLTTIAGFLAFAGSAVLPVFQLSIFASFGIALAWVLTVVAAPFLLVVVWNGSTRGTPPTIALAERVLSWWSTTVLRRRRTIVGAFAVGGVLLLGLTALKADTDYVKFFRSGSRVPSDYTLLKQAGFPQNPLNLVFQVPTGESPTLPRYREPLRAFVNKIEALPGVQSVLSPFVMSDLTRIRPEYAETLGGMLSRDGDQIQVIAMMDYPSSQRLFALLPRIRASADSLLPPEMRMIPSGTSYLWARMDDGVIETQRESLVIVCVACFFILFLLFRSPGLAVIGLGASLLPVAMVLGLMGLLGLPVNLATVLIAGVAVGLAVDDTIHLVHSYQAHRRSGKDRSSACSEALLEVGIRMVMTSVILIGAFASMGFSNFLPTSQFGILSSLTIALALAADMLLLPVLLAGRSAAVRKPFPIPQLTKCTVARRALSRRSRWVSQ